MIISESPKIELLNIDCMEYMAGVPDKFFDLAIVDPPYGWGEKLSGRNVNGDCGHWNTRPTNEYFIELFRVSKHQIIWGGNYFGLPAHRHFIIWDKKQPVENFSRCEFAWSSMEKNATIFEYSYYGNIGSDPGRFHPTQKPIKLYRWLLKNYAKEGDKILDTHGGSMSSAIACHQMGFDLTLCELDKDYYEAGVKRFREQTMQQSLFKP